MEERYLLQFLAVLTDSLDPIDDRLLLTLVRSYGEIQECGICGTINLVRMRSEFARTWRKEEISRLGLRRVDSSRARGDRGSLG